MTAEAKGPRIRRPGEILSVGVSADLDRVEKELVQMAATVAASHERSPEANAIIDEYDRRGAPIGDLRLPPLLLASYWLKRYGVPTQIGKDIRELAAMRKRTVGRPIRDSDVSAFDQIIQSKRRQLKASRTSEAILREGEWKYENGEIKVDMAESGRGSPTLFRNKIVRDTFQLLEPNYRRAWPEDTAKIPGKLCGHVCVLLMPYLGELDLDAVRNAVRQRR